MAATLYVPTPLRKLTNGQSKLAFQAGNIAEIIERAEDNYPGFRERVLDQDGEIKRFINVFVNGVDVRQLQGKATALRDGDEVSVIPAMAGGRSSAPMLEEPCTAGFPNCELLVDDDWLEQHLGDESIRILDVRASDPRLPVGYRMGHVPGAVAFDPTREFFVFANGTRELSSPDKISNALASHGVSNESTVVIYDEWTGQLAALSYWVLRYVGHQDVKVLHGGWSQWRANARTISRSEPRIVQGLYQAHPSPDARATSEWIHANRERQDVFLLDVRSPGEYKMGHIPGAVNLPYDTVLDVNTQTFKNADEVQALLTGIGATADKEIVTYCEAGSRSAHMYATLQLLNYPRARNYDGSMVDWYRLRGLPIE